MTAPSFIPMVTVCRSPTDHEGTPRVETSRFDSLTRTFATLFSRRTLAGVLGLGALTPDLGEAKKKRKKKCKGKKKKCGKKCIAKSACCKDSECSEGESCCSGQCSAPVYCGDVKTCGCGEVCKAESGGGNYACQDGACPDFNYCNESGSYYCGVCDGTGCCVCATSLAGTNGCVEVNGFASASCASDDDCAEALGQPALCIAAGPDCSDVGPTICAPRCRGGSPLRAAG